MSLKQHPYLSILVLAFMALSCKSSDDPIEEVKPQEPKIIYDLVKIEYSFSDEDKITQVPDYIGVSSTVGNITSNSQTIPVMLSKNYIETSDFTNYENFDMTTLEPSKVGVPFVPYLHDDYQHTQVQAGILSIAKWLFGAKSEFERKFEQNLTLDVPEKNAVTATLKLNMYKLSANYTATLKNKLNGEIKTISGKWYGLQPGEAQIEIKQ